MSEQKEVKSENIKIRLTPTQKKKLKNFLEDRGVKNLSEFVREILLTGEYKIKNVKCKQYESDLIYNLNKIGNNLNQTVKYINRHKEIDRFALNSIELIKRSIETMLEECK